MTVPDRVAQYREERRAYDLRLAAWLELNPERLVSIDEELEDWSLKVTWESVGAPQEVAATDVRVPLPLNASCTDAQDPVFSGGVLLHPDEQERMRAEIGERPELLTLEERGMLALMRLGELP